MTTAHRRHRRIIAVVGSSCMSIIIVVNFLLILSPFAIATKTTRTTATTRSTRRWTITPRACLMLLEDKQTTVHQERVLNLVDLRGGGGGENGDDDAAIKKKKKRANKKKKKKQSKQNPEEETPKRERETQSVDKEEETLTEINSETMGDGVDGVIDKESQSLKDNKRVLKAALKEKDAATALGDAIRERAHILRQQDEDNPFLQHLDRSLSSLGWAMGASDWKNQTTTTKSNEIDDVDLEAPPTAVLTSYFLKSHGGAHAPQTLCSLLATVTATLSFLPSLSQSWRLVLVKRTLWFAMTKHVAGLLAAAWLAANAIPEMGLRNVRRWMEQLALDPVSQYVFYTALLLIWLPKPSSSSSSSPTPPIIWWLHVPFSLPLLVTPILIREMISTAFVVSDVLLLTSYHEHYSKFLTAVLSTMRAWTNACMSILVTPKVWRHASPAEQQVLLAKLAAQISLAAEIMVGLLLLVDALWGVFMETILFGGGNNRSKPSLMLVVKRMACARLYWNFLFVRKQKMKQLATSIRGGASQVPLRFLDVILHPLTSMGIAHENENKKIKTAILSSPPMDHEETTTWKDYLKLALGLDE